MKQKRKISMLAILLISSAITLNAQIGKALKGLTPAKHLEDQGITNATHQKYINQIVWSNEKIPFDNPDETRFKTNFNSGELIYGRFYLSESLQNLIYKEKRQVKDGFTFYFDVYIDGVKQEVEFDATNIGSDFNKATTWQIWAYIPRKDDVYGESDKWADLVNKSMTPGNHTVRFDLRVDGCEGIAVTGSLNFTKGKEPLNYGWNFDFYPSRMKDADLEADILKCIQTHAASVGWKEKFSKVKIHSTDWYIIQNEYGIITDRTVNAYCLATWPDGHCTVQSFSFSQQYTGSGYSKSVELYSVGKQEVADCE